MKYKAYTAEFIGTFALILVGCGAAVLNLELSAIGLAFGLILMAMIFSVGGFSGGHFNPAVSLTMVLIKKLSLKDFLFYVLSQLLGATLAVLMLVAFLGSNSNLASTTLLTDFGGQNQSIQLLLGLLVETVITFLFIFIILRVVSNKESAKFAGIIIGFALTAFIYFAGPLTGASLNPARSILPALFEGGLALEQLWIFVIGPLLGGTLAAIIHPLFDTKA